MTEIVKRFSERRGMRPVRDVIQIEDMDDELRMDLYNSIYLFFDAYWDRGSQYGSSQGIGKTLAQSLWCDLYHLAIDKFPLWRPDFLDFLKGEVLNGEWFDVYDLVEQLALDASRFSIQLSEGFNDIFEQNLAGYRFIENTLVAISSEEEVKSISRALNLSDKFAGARAHIKTATEMLSDREGPDYRNVVKEAISAIESAASVLGAHDGKPRFGDLINRLESRGAIHPALSDAWKKIYGFASDEGGIRHALIAEPSSVDFKMAKYMLVSCSAFLNYIVQSDSEGLGE